MSFSALNTRRKFLVDCFTAVTAFALVPMASFTASASAGGSSQSLDQMSYELFARQINTLFRVRLSSGRTVELKLLKTPLAQSTPITGRQIPGDFGNEKFSLIFSGSNDVLLTSAIHQFEHEQLGNFEMHLGRIGAPDANYVRYEAAFNRKKST